MTQTSNKNQNILTNKKGKESRRCVFTICRICISLTDEHPPRLESKTLKQYCSLFSEVYFSMHHTTAVSPMQEPIDPVCLPMGQAQHKLRRRHLGGTFYVSKSPDSKNENPLLSCYRGSPSRTEQYSHSLCKQLHNGWLRNINSAQ